MTDALQVVTTTPDEATAQRIASRLIDRRLAACVQVEGPIASTYRWQGSIENSQEWRCTIKTRRDHFDRIEALLRDMHPYDEPEVLALPVVAGSAGYLAWLAEQTENSV